MGNMSYIIHREKQGNYLVFSGSLTSEDLINCNKEFYADPDFPTYKYVIINFNAVEKFPIETSAIRAVAEMDAEHVKINPNLKTAIVANQRVITGLTNMYQTFFELAGNNPTWETQIFETLEEARKWLDP